MEAKPEVWILGCASEVLKDEIFKELGYHFDLRFKENEDELDLYPIDLNTNESRLLEPPGPGRPGAILQLTTSGEVILKEDTRGPSRLALDPSSLTSSQHLTALRSRLMLACQETYKDQAKAVRRLARGSGDWRVRVRANWMAGRAEAMAGDLEAGVKAYHVCLSALVTHINASNDSALAEVADELAACVIRGLGQQGQADEAAGYINAHLNWAKASPFRRAALYLAVSSAFPERLERAKWCMRASLLLISTLPPHEDNPMLREALTRAFDEFAAAGACMRHLVHLSLLSSLQFHNQANFPVLAERFGEEGWSHVSEMLLEGETGRLGAAWIVGQAELPPGSLVFRALKDSRQLVAAARLSESGVHVALFNARLSKLYIERIEALLVPDFVASLTVNEEIGPGGHAEYTIQGLPEGYLKIDQVKLHLGIEVELTFESTALATRVLPETRNVSPAFDRVLLPFTIAGQSRVGKARKPRGTIQVRHEGIAAAGIQISFSLRSDYAMVEMSLVLMELDHGGISEDLKKSLPANKEIHITWPSAGHKSILFQLESMTEPPVSLPYSLDIIDPFRVSFSQPLGADLLIAQIKCVFPCRISGWKLLSSDGVIEAVNGPPGEVDLLTGDVFRVGFICSDASDMALAVDWSTPEGHTATFSTHVILLVSNHTFRLSAACSKSKARIGQCISLEYTLTNLHPSPTHLSLALELSPDSPWILQGPMSMETNLPSFGSVCLAFKLVALNAGLLDVPVIQVSHVQSSALPISLDASSMPRLLILE